MLEAIRKIAMAKKEAKKACNQIAAYEIDQQINKLTDELVSLYEESERQSASQQQEPYDTIECSLCTSFPDANKEKQLLADLLDKAYQYYKARYPGSTISKTIYEVIFLEGYKAGLITNGL